MAAFMRAILTTLAIGLFLTPALANIQIYRTAQHGADENGNIVWTPQTIVSMTDEQGQYFDLEFEADAGLVMYDAHGKTLWSTNTGGHDCRTGYCALRWTVDGLLQILVETQRGPQPIWSTNTFGDNQGQFLTFGVTVPFVAVYSHNYTVVFPQPTADQSQPDVLSLCGTVPCYSCYDLNCLGGGDDGTQGSGVYGDPGNQPGFSG